MTLRNIPWTAVATFAKEPLKVYSGIVIIQALLLDSVVLCALNIYVSIWLSKGTEDCTAKEIGNWNTIAFSFNILFWIYNSFWLFILGTVCFIGSIVACVMCCASGA